jgi:hypothetical protein
MPDQTKQCQDCGAPFVFTDGERLYYEKMQFSEPKRCGPCRRAARANYAARSGSRGEYKEKRIGRMTGDFDA